MTGTFGKIITALKKAQIHTNILKGVFSKVGDLKSQVRVNDLKNHPKVNDLRKRAKSGYLKSQTKVKNLKKHAKAGYLKTHTKVHDLKKHPFVFRLLSKMAGRTHRPIFLRLRFLPIVIFCSSLLLTVKISFLWKNLHPDEEIWGMAETYAEKPAQKAPSKKAKKSQKKKGGKDETVHNVTVKDIDPTLLTREQFKVLLELSQRQKDLAKREKKIPREEATLSVIDQQIRDHTAELEKTKKRLEDLLSKFEEKENVNTARLVKMAENMKPKDAAKILETLDFSVLLELMENIKPKSGSAILSSMEPSKAGYLMTELSKRRKLIKSGSGAK